MAYTANSSISTQSVKSALATIGTLASTGAAWTISLTVTTNLATLFTANANGARITSLLLASTDSAAVNTFLVLNPGGSGNLTILSLVNVPITSGTAAAAPSAVDALSKTTLPGLPLDNYGKPYLHLGPNDILYVGVLAAMTANKILFATAMAEQY